MWATISFLTLCPPPAYRKSVCLGTAEAESRLWRPVYRVASRGNLGVKQNEHGQHGARIANSAPPATPWRCPSFANDSGAGHAGVSTEFERRRSPHGCDSDLFFPDRLTKGSAKKQADGTTGRPKTISSDLVVRPNLAVRIILVVRFVSHEKHVRGPLRLLYLLRNVRYLELDYSEAVILCCLGKKSVLRLAEPPSIDRLLQLGSDTLG